VKIHRSDRAKRGARAKQIV